jgi:hypothetical protein
VTLAFVFFSEEFDTDVGRSSRRWFPSRADCDEIDVPRRSGDVSRKEDVASFDRLLFDHGSQ